MNKVKTNVHFCEYIKTHTYGTIMHAGESRRGVLSMYNRTSDGGEIFEFLEQDQESYSRNPIVYRGRVLNVHKTKQKELVVCFKRALLTKDLNADIFADEVAEDLYHAKMALGV